MNSPTRPVLRWLGSKWRLAPWLIAHMPPHDVYVEPFGGSAAVLMQKPRARMEIYNDVDDDVVNLFQVLRDGAKANELWRLLVLTPHARAELANAFEPAPEADAVERARRLLVRSWQGYGSDGAHGRRTGLRNSTTSNQAPAVSWAGYPAEIPAFAERMAGVLIEKLPALQLLTRYDNPDTLFYLDPPYMPATRRAAGKHRYKHEMSPRQHVALLKAAAKCRAHVLISGYQHPLYTKHLAAWKCVTTEARDEASAARQECLWIAPHTFEALHADMFSPTRQADRKAPPCSK